MRWNWQLPDWPDFRFDADRLRASEEQFLKGSGVVIGALHHLDADERDGLTIELISQEVVDSSAIEGEILDRASVQSSLARHLGFATDSRRASAAEAGAAELMADVYRNHAESLDNQTLFAWHAMLMNGRRDITDVGRYRTHEDAMQIVSGALHAPRVHFEAPPSDTVPMEMARFIAWFNGSAPASANPLPAITRAAISHLWFESIHPFEDGNGRLGRALAEKSLAQNIGQPSLIALAYTIERDRKGYYDRLEAHQKTLDVTAWLLWFGETVLNAQQVTLTRVAFFIAKAKFYDKFRDRLNDRQAKVIERMFREGPKGFKGGLSAENYIAITGTSRATTTRDLQDLVEMGALMRTGERRHTRYWLLFESEQNKLSDQPPVK